MYNINFDELGKKVLVRCLEKERKIYEEKILDGDESPGTLIMHEQLFKMMRGILYTRAKKEETEVPSDSVDSKEVE